MTENEAIKDIKENIKPVVGGLSLDMAISAIEEIQEHREFEKIFKEHFSDDNIKLLSNKEEFGKWLERGKWIAKRCDEINRESEKFKALGTVEELRKAMEKQRAKKPVKRSFIIPYDGIDVCPNCKRPISRGEHHCECGQAIDWSEEE